MADYPKHIHIMEVGPRDGLQMEARCLSVAEKVALIDMLADAGLTEIEVGSFVHPARVPQMADTDAVFAALSRREGVDYRALWLNLRGLERAVAAGADITAKLSIATSETFSRRNVGRSFEESLAAMPDWLEVYAAHGLRDVSLGVMTAFGCTYEGHVPEGRTVAMIARVAERLDAQGFRLAEVDLADTTGWGNPLQVSRVVGAIRERWPELPIKLHLHDTRGCGIANAIAGLALGVDRFDASIGGLGGCPFAGLKGAAGNIATEDFAFVCSEMGIETGLDPDALAAAARHAETLVGRPLPGKVFRAGHRRPTASTVTSASG
ncbi:hydroxymethylglutaryl-CoA lyase [Acuticoccus sediminis]|uniref:Hydroxymethylglutaryl-CoA lyase n=1 Tax=Acuticoccus sediminis TaxID=2184697 RepID=A0A8B2NUY7_9HYPH|nr:hydroxymethylglutaryl-CoA lyase [Acuticoccus sediminis]RAI02118.1 hydroxymethylglutaryl-CoA lyase [Acuticoccus sediminis]